MATDTQITNEAGNADMTDRFVDALGLNPIEWVRLAAAGEEGRPALIREFVGAREPSVLLDAIDAADPSAQELTEMMREDPELATQFRDSFANDPAVLENIQLYANEGVMGPLVASVLPPEQMLSKIGELAGIEIPEAAMQDEAFKAALHNAVANDETVLSGMMDLQNRETSDFSPDTLGDMLADERARGVLTQTLNSVAENDHIGFSDVVTFGNAFASGDYVEIQRQAQDLGVTLPPPSGDEMMAMMQAYVNDPIGSARTITSLLNVDPDSIQGQFFTEMFEVLGQFVEMILGGEGGIRDYLQHYIPVGTEFVQDAMYRASGDADADLAAQTSVTVSGMDDVGGSTEEILTEFAEFNNARVSLEDMIDGAAEPVEVAIAAQVEVDGPSAASGAAFPFEGYGQNVAVDLDLCHSFTRCADPAPAAPEEEPDFDQTVAAAMQPPRAVSSAPMSPGGGSGW